MHSVIVTGGSRGLGLGIAGALASSGFRVIAIARNQGDAFHQAAERVAREDRGALHFRAFDLADIDGLAGLVKMLRHDFGPIYGLVNNAALGTGGILTNMPVATIDHLTRLNIVSPLALTKYTVRSMMTGEGGRIVNISSVVASTGYTGLSVYSATKAALIGFTHSLARELGPLGITVNAVAPGFVDTEMTHAMDAATKARIERRSALKRMPQIADIAAAVDFLFSHKACNITGTVMTVDAGNTA
jgi:3-oxoacyl-[acyl-carrier protein] reductase